MTYTGFRMVIWPLCLLVTGCSAFTEYVSGNATIIVGSVAPCYIFGDADLYGLGARLSIYIQFGASLLGVLFGLVEEVKPLRFGFNVLYVTILIILIQNVLQGSFALFEWYITSGLMLLLPAALLLPTVGSISDEAYLYHPLGRNGEGELDTPASTVDTVDDGVRIREDALNEEIRKWETRVDRLFVTDGVGIGVLLLLYSVFLFLNPWIYFTNANSGHRNGCVVLIRFFGTFDLYDANWQRFLKASAVFDVLMGIGTSILGNWVAVKALLYWKIRERVLEDMHNDRNAHSRVLFLLKRYAELLRQQNHGQDQPLDYDLSPNNAARQLLQDTAEQIRQAQGRDESNIPPDEAKIIVNDAIQRAADFKVQKKAALYSRAGLVAALAAGGGLSIWFIEDTLQLNNIDMDDQLSNSNGQLLAFLVAIFTTVGFLFEALKKIWKDYEIRKGVER